MAFDWQQCFADLRLRYEGTYVRVAFPKAPDKRELYYVMGVGQGAESHPHLELHNSTVGRVVINYQSDCDVYFDYPDPGYFFYRDKIALLFYKTHHRQNRRGLSKNTGVFVSPYGSMTVGSDTGAFTEETINAAFAPRTYPSIADAIQLLETSALSVPLSSDLALGIHPDESMADASLLWYQNQPIGYYRNGFVIEETQFSQEVTDYLKHKGLHETSVRSV